MSHILLAVLLFAASIWHWTYLDLDVFRDCRTSALALDLPKIFGIHLSLAGLLCLGFGAFHCAVYPGIWVSDVCGLTGSPTVCSPEWGAEAFDSYNPGGIVGHHLVAGLVVGIVAGIFHLTCRPSYALYTVLRIGNLETVLASILPWLLGQRSLLLGPYGMVWYGMKCVKSDRVFRSDMVYVGLGLVPSGGRDHCSALMKQ